MGVAYGIDCFDQSHHWAYLLSVHFFRSLQIRSAQSGSVTRHSLIWWADWSALSGSLTRRASDNMNARYITLKEFAVGSTQVQIIDWYHCVWSVCCVVLCSCGRSTINIYVLRGNLRCIVQVQNLVVLLAVMAVQLKIKHILCKLCNEYVYMHWMPCSEWQCKTRPTDSLTHSYISSSSSFMQCGVLALAYYYVAIWKIVYLSVEESVAEWSVV